MDLVTLLTACALAVDPNGLPSGPGSRVMHALISQQSPGAPWSFSAPGHDWPRVFPTAQDAIREAPATVGGRIHLGLTGLRADGRSATAAMFAPCPNITVAARQTAQLAERRTIVSRFKADPIYCGIAAYHGSWERPDAVFADAVKATVVKGDAQNFDMSEDAYFDTSDAAGDALKPDPHAAPIALGAPFDDHDRAWSSALFPLKLPQTEPSSTDVPNRGPSAVEMRSPGRAAAVPTPTTPPADSLFVPSSTRWSLGGAFADVSRAVDCFCMFECEGGQGRGTRPDEGKIKRTDVRARSAR